MKLWGLEWSALDSYFQFVEQGSSPGTPETGHIRLYAKDAAGVSSLCYKTDAGTEVCLPTSGAPITGSGTDNQVAIWNGTSAIDAFGATAGSVLFAGVGGILAQDNANLFWDDTNNYLGVLTATPAEPLDVRGDVRLGSTSSPPDVFWNDTNKDLVLGASTQPGSSLNGRGLAVVRTGTVAEVDLYGYSSTGTQVGLRLLKPRGGVGSETATQTDDGGFIAFGGYQSGGAFLYTASQITGRAAENWTGSAQGSYLTLDTIAIGATTLTERFRVGPSGQLGIGGATYGSSGNVLTSGGSGAAPSWAAPATQTSTLLDGSVHTDTAAQTVSRGSLVYGNSTPKWDELMVGASAGMFLRTDATDAMWSTLILPNAITANQLVYGSATNTYGASADLTYDGTDLAIASGKRFRMQSQNRTRYLNAGCTLTQSADLTALAVNTFTTVTFDGEDADTDALHSTVSNTSRITVNQTGFWVFSCTALLDPTGVVGIQNFQFRVIRNGGTTAIYAPTRITAIVPPNNNPGINGSGCIYLTSGDYIEMQTSVGGASGTYVLSGSATGKYPYFTAAFIGE